MVQAKLNPYIAFLDETRQAMEFYQSVFGGKLLMQTFKDYHISKDPYEDHKIMHAVLMTDNGMTIMASDTPDGVNYKAGTNFSIFLSGDDEEALTGYYEKLTVDAQIAMPLIKAPWGGLFGLCTDKFGVSWVLKIGRQKAVPFNGLYVNDPDDPDCFKPRRGNHPLE